MKTANRYSFSEVTNNFFYRCEEIAKQDRKNWCCLSVDIEHFKLLNEIYGLEKGDELLSAIHAALKKLEKEIGCISTYQGNDDFIIFMDYDRKIIDDIYAEIRNIIEQICNTSGFLPAIGVYRLEENEDISLMMCDRAAAVMLEAKKSHVSRIYEYDPGTYNKKNEEYHILLELKKAADQDQMTFYLQPQCNIATGKIVGAEALMRWIDSEGKMISPAAFIPILEKNNFIADFDRIIWEKVCIWLHSLMEKGIKPVPISINISQIDILMLDVAEILCSLCEKYGIPSGFLKVEITESSYAEAYDRVQALVKKLKEKNFIVMMDDFGSGYSSLNMLETVSVDVLKLDMAFMKKGTFRSRKGLIIIESIVNMAKRMGLPIVVEGVETIEQVEFLQKLGCKYAQGYYYYEPLPITKFEEQMAGGEHLDYSGLTSKMNEEFHIREFLDENIFTDTVLNHILGAVAIYSLDGKDLTITRFNELFYEAISDDSMETRQQGIQHYVVEADRPLLYKALEDACSNTVDGGVCEVRFYKSDSSVFWFRMHFFYLRNENDKKIFYGQIQDVTQAREQSLQFFDVLRSRSDLSMVINLEQKTLRYITGFHTALHRDSSAIDMEESIDKTMKSRIDSEEDKQRFREFFDSERLKATYSRAIYHESMRIGFRMNEQIEPVEFSTYYIRYSKEQELNVFVFIKRLQ